MRWWCGIWCQLLLTVVLNELGSVTANSQPVQGRLCVSEGVDCSNLIAVSGGVLTCVTVRDRVDCLKKLRDHEADFGYFEAEDLNIASHFFKDNFVAPIQILPANARVEEQRVYLLVHNASNPEIRSMCHPGFQLQRAIPRALYRPVTIDPNLVYTDIQSHISSLSEVWTSACIPGAWSPDPILDQKLKQEHTHLCSACLRQNCDSDDPYSGDGLLQCVLDHAADAAFVSDVVFQKARAENPAVENLSHFCPSGNGNIQPLGSQVNDESEPCDWGRRPLPHLLATPCDDEDCTTRHTVWIAALTSKAKAVVEVLGLPEGTKVEAISDSHTPSEIIRAHELRNEVNTSQPENPVKFCVHDEIELAKCQDLEMAAKGYDADAGIGVGCVLDVNSTTRCFPDIYFGRADVIALDGGDVYQVSQDFGFKRVLSEVYDFGPSSVASSYYAVAVVRAESNITNFEDLKGRKSCHTGIGKTAGWKMPVATLLEKQLITHRHCNYVNAMAEFFSGGSCAPGGRSSKYNKQSNYVERLCSLCTGEGEAQCARSSAEPFYSYSGAFRCLVHGGGDVAFVKHTTVPDNTDGKGSDWAIGLQSDQFRLLCPYGGRAAVTEYETCHLTLVPAHEVVVSGRMTERRKSEVQQVLLGVSQVFKKKSPGSKTFNLFGKYLTKSDLLFKDSAAGLRALSEDSLAEKNRKEDYFRKMKELNSCEVRVCALEDQMSDCEAMADTLRDVGLLFTCVSARDRFDCVRRVVRGQVDMAPVSGSYLGVNNNLRIFAFMRDPNYTLQKYRYKAVYVVRRATIKGLKDLRGKKACHTGYGRTTGWRIPVAMLKRAGIIDPPCGLHQSALEHEIAAVATTFNRACVPGMWANTPNLDAALKERYSAMCSMCSSRTCDRSDDYTGYEGALRCLTQNNADIAFTKLSVAKRFFEENNRTVDEDDYGLLCENGKVVDIFTPEAEQCFWAARPWDAYVTHGAASETKVKQLFGALTKAKIEGEADLETRKWYRTTLGLGDDFIDIWPALSNIRTQEYYGQSKLDIVEAETMCNEKPVRLCVRNDDEETKCKDLSDMLQLRGVEPPLKCVRGRSSEHCVSMVVTNKADVVSLNDVERYKANQGSNLVNLLSEDYGEVKDTVYYLVAVIKKTSNATGAQSLFDMTSCHLPENSTTEGKISTLSECLDGTSDFYHNYADAFLCLVGSNKDVAFVKHSTTDDTDLESLNKTGYLDSKNFQLLCVDGVAEVTVDNVRNCNLARVPSNMVVTRQSESSGRKDDIQHVFLEAVYYFGRSSSFFRLFFDYYSKKDLIFKDSTTKLTPLADEHYQIFMESVWQGACRLYDHHVRLSTPSG